jgi:hypothetical protein
LRCARREENAGIKWSDAEEDFLGDVYCARSDRGYGVAVVVGVGGYDSDWDCELVVCVPDGLVLLGRIAKAEEDAGLKSGATKATSRTASRADGMADARWETR